MKWYAEDIPAYAIVGGVPAKIIKTIDGDVGNPGRKIYYATKDGTL